jgi:signal transduction histidine kinase
MALGVFFLITRLRALEINDQEQKAKLLATQLANLLAYDGPRETAKMRKLALSFLQTHQEQVLEIHLYGVVKGGALREIPLAMGSAGLEEIAPADLPVLKRGEPVSRQRYVSANNRAEIRMYAAAPIFDGSQFQGAVSLLTHTVRYSALSRRIIILTLALLSVAILSIIAFFYFLFSQVIYKPVEDFLRLTGEVRNGNLDVKAPVRAADEFGVLAQSFNHMVSRLREMTEERQAHQVALEHRVQEATTELAERNSQLEDANRVLFEIQRELTKFERLAAAGQLAAQFAHEVGTPLNLISGHVQLLSTRSNDPKSRERLDLISSQIDRIERIVRNMMDATRRPPLILEPTDLNTLLRKIFEVTAPTLSAHQVDLLIDFAPDLPAIRGDNEQLQQVFINLIKNSLDAMPQGGKLQFATAKHNGHVEVTCRDTGAGIREDIKSRIFDPLFTTKEHGKGSGLGLAVVQQIVREHGGRIEVQSNAGEGAEFRLSFPVMDGGGEEETRGQGDAIQKQMTNDK